MKAATYMQIAYLVAQNSKCCSWKVGAVIEKNGRIISTGYNGSPAGAVNCCDHADEQGWILETPKKKILLSKHRSSHSDWSKVNEIHAELNAILYAARHGLSIEGATMYVTASPCPDCAKAITQSGIKQVVFCEAYDRNVEGWDTIMKETGISVHQLSKRNLTNLDWSSIQIFCGE